MLAWTGPAHPAVHRSRLDERGTETGLGRGVGGAVGVAGVGAGGEVEPQRVQRAGVTGGLVGSGAGVDSGVPAGERDGRTDQAEDGLVVGVGVEADAAVGVLGRHPLGGHVRIEAQQGLADLVLDPPGREQGERVRELGVHPSCDLVADRLQLGDDRHHPRHGQHTRREQRERAGQDGRQAQRAPDELSGRPIGDLAGDGDLSLKGRPGRRAGLVERAARHPPGQPRQDAHVLRELARGRGATAGQQSQVGAVFLAQPRARVLQCPDVCCFCHAGRALEHTGERKANLARGQVFSRPFHRRPHRFPAGSRSVSGRRQARRVGCRGSAPPLPRDATALAHAHPTPPVL